MKHILYFGLYFLLAFPLVSQDIYTFRNPRGNVFTVFQNGRFYYPDESQILPGYLTGNNGIIYRNSQRETKLYEDGLSRKILDVIPDRMDIRGERMAWLINGNIYTTKRNQIKHLGGQVLWYEVTDSFIIFQDKYGSLQIFNEQCWLQPEIRPIKDKQIGRTVAAWTNVRDEWVVFQSNQIAFRQDYAPDYFKCGGKILVYVDRDGIWKTLWNRKSYILSQESLLDTPKCGENVVAWVNRHHEFECFRNGQRYLIDFQPPRWYKVQDSLIVFQNAEGQLKIFDQGKSYLLENGTQLMPSQCFIFGSMVVWLNRFQHVMKFEEGKTEDISNEIAYDLALHGRVIVFKTGVDDLHIHWKFQKHKILSSR